MNRIRAVLRPWRFENLIVGMVSLFFGMMGRKKVDRALDKEGHGQC